jgi:hypothetical protein
MIDTDSDGGIGILELKEQIGWKGSDLGSDAVALLRKCRQYRPGWFEAFRRRQLVALEQEFDDLHAKFLAHGGYVASYLSMATKPIRSADDEGNEVERIGFESHFPMLVYSHHLTSQYDSLRAVLADVGNVLAAHRNEANNRVATAFALAALVLAVIGLFV